MEHGYCVYSKSFVQGIAVQSAKYGVRESKPECGRDKPPAILHHPCARCPLHTSDFTPRVNHRGTCGNNYMAQKFNTTHLSSFTAAFLGESNYKVSNYYIS